MHAFFVIIQRDCPFFILCIYSYSYSHYFYSSQISIVTGYLTTGPSLQYQQISHKPVSTVAPTIQNKIEHNLWSDKILPHYYNDKIQPHNNSDKIQLHNNSDKIEVQKNNDKIPLQYSNGNILPNRRGIVADKTTDIENNKQGITDTRPVVTRSQSVTEQCPARLGRIDTARRSASLVGRPVSSDRYNSDKQFRDNILHLLTTRLQERQDNRQDI